MTTWKYLKYGLKGTAFLLFFLLLPLSCSPSKGVEQALPSIQTQVALSMDATHTVQASLVEQSRQESISSVTLSPTRIDIATATLLPTLTTTNTPSPTYTETPILTPTGTPVNGSGVYVPVDAIGFYLTKVGTGGTVGCGDSLVKLSTSSSRSGDTAWDLKIALDAIFSVGQYVGELYNATYPSSLKVGDVILDSNGTTIVYFKGSYVKPADGCDASRYRAQVWSTALQFKEITRFEPHVGNSLLGDRLAVYSDSGK